MNKFIGEFCRIRAISAMAIPVATALIQAAVVLVAGAAPESDIFHPSTALQPFWRFVDPAGNCALNLTGSTADISIPGGSSHDLWSGAGNVAPRLLQAAPNADFGIEIKFNSLPSLAYQIQGLIVQESNTRFLRFDTHHNGSSLKLFAVYIDGTSNSIKHNDVPVAGVIPRYLRVERAGNNWTFRYSQDGAAWVDAVTFSQALTVTECGFFAGNHTPNPAFTASAAYFNNLASPLIDDGGVPPPAGPTIDLWYGDTQSFGELGNPQTWEALAKPPDRVRSRLGFIMGRP